jgi:hypothetical protein
MRASACSLSRLVKVHRVSLVLVGSCATGQPAWWSHCVSCCVGTLSVGGSIGDTDGQYIILTRVSSLGTANSIAKGDRQDDITVSAFTIRYSGVPRLSQRYLFRYGFGIFSRFHRIFLSTYKCSKVSLFIDGQKNGRGRRGKSV